VVLIAIPACLLRFIAGCPEPFSLPLQPRMWTAQWSQRLLCFLRVTLLSASRIADRRLILAGYRLADLLAPLNFD
jgi:hypothetical protein